MMAHPVRSVQRSGLSPSKSARRQGRSTITATSDPHPLRIGIVGAGKNTQDRHIPGLLAIDNVEISAVCNRTVDSAQVVARRFGIPTVHTSWRHLVDDDRIDAVVIGTWPYMHHPITLAALASGKHVLCEARMSMNSTEAHAMLQAAHRRPDLVAQLVPSPLSFQVDATIRRLIAEGYLGTLHAVDIEYRIGSFPDPKGPLHWREDARLSGNNIMALGIWYESLMRWIGEARSVVAMGKVTVPLRHTNEGLHTVRIPDHLDVIATMECGAQARFHFSTVTGPEQVNRATLYGSDALVRFESGRLEGHRRGAANPEPIDIPDHEAAAWRVEQDFVEAIRGGGEIRLTDFATGVRYMEFTDAVWLSMQQRRAISLPLLTRA
jgi:predicted dehydrogenase